MTATLGIDGDDDYHAFVTATSTLTSLAVQTHVIGPDLRTEEAPPLEHGMLTSLAVQTHVIGPDLRTEEAPPLEHGTLTSLAVQTHDITRDSLPFYAQASHAWCVPTP